VQDDLSLWCFVLTWCTSGGRECMKSAFFAAFVYLCVWVCTYVTVCACVCECARLSFSCASVQPRGSENRMKCPVFM
jgi:hypothetical protein